MTQQVALMAQESFFSEWLNVFLSSTAWLRVTALPPGAWIGGGALLLVVLLGWAVALDRMWDRACHTKKRAEETKGWMKALAFAVLFLLPGGMIGAAAVAVIVGKKYWRASAVLIQFMSVIPFLAVGWLSWTGFPWPWIVEDIWVNGTLGLTFGLLQLWATLKLLREAWGEPKAKVAWWPPMALWMQTLFLVDAALVVFL
jgi:hypothetical protein